MTFDVDNVKKDLDIWMLSSQDQSDVWNVLKEKYYRNYIETNRKDTILFPGPHIIKKLQQKKYH